MTAASVAVLGVSAQYHDAAAALVIDGEVIAAAQEERFTRVKGDPSLPVRSIEYVLGAAQLAPEQLTGVAFYESPFAKFDRILSTQMLGKVAGVGMFVRSVATWLPDKLWIGRDLRDLLGRDIDLRYGDHHQSHAAAAFFPSPFESAAVLTVDGVGEWSSTSIGRGAGPTVELLEHVEYPNSIGMLYSAFTLYCGFKINSGEYKLMGLAPYGTPRFADRIRAELCAVFADGSFALNPAYFSYLNRRFTYNERFEQLLGAPTRRADAPLTQHYADVAASIQAVTDEAMLALAVRAHERTGERNLCLAGGVALNVVSVGHIERHGPFDNVWVQPAAGDAGSALGAAMWASHMLYDVPRHCDGADRMHGAFLGPTPSEAEPASTPSVLEQYGLVVEDVDPAGLAVRVAELVEHGAVVAVARGRMEFGPRALGNRSILADARSPEMQLRLNMKTKFREGFRPFAPIVLAERAAAYFEMGAAESPYMLKTYPVLPALRAPESARDAGRHHADEREFYERAKEVRSTLPAVTHLDYSARVQTVDAQRNPFLHAVLAAFESTTGCAVLVNTSFNVRGEPIVASATDAVECFLHTDIDALLLEDQLVIRANQTPAALRPRRASARAAD
jgi:carbamoyltransferase